MAGIYRFLRMRELLICGRFELRMGRVLAWLVLSLSNTSFFSTSWLYTAVIFLVSFLIWPLFLCISTFFHSCPFVLSFFLSPFSSIDLSLPFSFSCFWRSIFVRMWSHSRGREDDIPAR